MRRADKQAWLSALRSGEYTQGEGALQELTVLGIRNCCLGVLCRINNVPAKRGGHRQALFSFEGESGVLPAQLAATLNINPHGMMQMPEGLWTLDGGTSVYATNLNDNGFTFGQIADLIEYLLPVED